MTSEGNKGLQVPRSPDAPPTAETGTGRQGAQDLSDGCACIRGKTNSLTCQALLLRTPHAAGSCIMRYRFPGGPNICFLVYLHVPFLLSGVLMN